MDSLIQNVWDNQILTFVRWLQLLLSGTATPVSFDDYKAVVSFKDTREEAVRLSDTTGATAKSLALTVAPGWLQCLVMIPVVGVLVGYGYHLPVVATAACVLASAHGVARVATRP